jgi:hypothetical protein
VNQFLQHEVSPAVFAQVSFFQQAAEILYIPVQITGNQQFSRFLELYQAPAPAERASKSLDSLCQGTEKTVGIRHGWTEMCKLAAFGGAQKPEAQVKVLRLRFRLVCCRITRGRARRSW